MPELGMVCVCVCVWYADSHFDPRIYISFHQILFSSSHLLFPYYLNRFHFHSPQSVGYLLGHEIMSRYKRPQISRKR